MPNTTSGDTVRCRSSEGHHSHIGGKPYTGLRTIKEVSHIISMHNIVFKLQVFVSFSPLGVVLEEEYVLMDIFAVVAAIGGAMGIFLGWSCLDGARLVIRSLQKMSILE